MVLVDSQKAVWMTSTDSFLTIKHFFYSVFFRGKPLRDSMSCLLLEWISRASFGSVWTLSVAQQDYCDCGIKWRITWLSEITQMISSVTFTSRKYKTNIDITETFAICQTYVFIQESFHDTFQTCIYRESTSYLNVWEQESYCTDLSPESSKKLEGFSRDWMKNPVGRSLLETHLEIVSLWNFGWQPNASCFSSLLPTSSTHKCLCIKDTVSLFSLIDTNKYPTRLRHHHVSRTLAGNNMVHVLL
jgi:hypothetical protein